MATVLIKRYANRKLYNTETSRYITLKGLGELQRNVREAICNREEEAARWRDSARAEWDEMVHGAVERVFKALDLPRRSDIEVLNANLERVAAALEQLDGEREAPPAAPPHGDPLRRAAADD